MRFSAAMTGMPRPPGGGTAWGLEVLSEPKDYSSSLTAVLLPDGHDADAFRAGVLQKFNMSLGNGLSKLAGKVFHLGDFNDLMLLGTLVALKWGFPWQTFHTKKVALTRR